MGLLYAAHACHASANPSGLVITELVAAPPRTSKGVCACGGETPVASLNSEDRRSFDEKPRTPSRDHSTAKRLVRGKIWVFVSPPNSFLTHVRPLFKTLVLEFGGRGLREHVCE